MAKKAKIVFTGGGSAGHVVPTLPIIKDLVKDGWDVHYIGSYSGIEKQIITNRAIEYSSICTGKLRRYFSWQNFLDPFKIVLGIIQAIALIFKLRPDVIFSKGGFVAFPVVFAGWINRVPIIVHESDYSPGLANRMSFIFSKKICLTFNNEILQKSEKVIYTGNLIRDEVISGSAEIGKNICSFTKNLPVLLFIGGGNGSWAINNLVAKHYNFLTSHYNIIQITGIGNSGTIQINPEQHIIFEYVETELPHLFAYSDCIITRAGSNTIHEILSIGKPHILIPLSEKVSRGDQVLNAKYFQKEYGSVVLEESELDDHFEGILSSTIANLSNYKNNLLSKNITTANKQIISIIKRYI